MIKSFRGKATRRIWQGEVSRKLPQAMQRVARRKLRMLNNAVDLADLRIPPANRLEPCKAIARASTAFASTGNGASAFAGPVTRKMSRSSITTDVERCHG